MPNPDFEQVAAAQKASADVVMALMRTSFEGMQRLAELNMAATRELVEGSVATAKTLAATKDINEVAHLNKQMAKPEQLMDYWRKVYDLVAQMQKDVTAVMQEHHGQFSKTAASAIQKNLTAAPGGDMFANAMKSMLEQTNKAFDNMTAAAGKMANMTGGNMQDKSDAATRGNAKK